MKKMGVFQIIIALLLAMACAKNDDVPRAKNLDSDIALVAKGCDDTRYDYWETSEYVLPYPVGKEYMVTLSHCGGSYHSTGEPDQFAVDFACDIGTLITAARAGTVVYVEESGEDGSFPNNLVIVQHSDGTFAQYMHFTRDGALVQKGDIVQQGDEIGLSGNTGLAGFPHLHFVVTQAGTFQYPYQSIPTTFKNTLANERSLKAGTRYPAYDY